MSAEASRESVEDSTELLALREGLERGDRTAVGALLERHRARLRRMVALRMDRRIQGRVDPSDVVQEAYLEAVERLERYAAAPDMPFFLWLRFLTAQKLLQIHRRHLGTQARDAARDVSLYRRSMPEATSAVLADRLVSHRTSPSEAAIRIEMKVRLQEALDAMEPADREVLALRQFEGLSTRETAHILGITEAAASQRYVRALRRLKKVFDTLGTRQRRGSGGADERTRAP